MAINNTTAPLKVKFIHKTQEILICFKNGTEFSNLGPQNRLIEGWPAETQLEKVFVTSHKKSRLAGNFFGKEWTLPNLIPNISQ